MSSIDAIRAMVSAIEQGRARLDVLSLNPVKNAAYSYDKRRFAVLGMDIVQVWRCDPLRWERSFLLPCVNYSANKGLAFSRDGSWLAVSGDGVIWRCDLEGDPREGGVSVLCAGAEDQETALCFAEDGRLIQATPGEDAPVVGAWDAQGRPVSAADLSLRVPYASRSRAIGLPLLSGRGRITTAEYASRSP